MIYVIGMGPGNLKYLTLEALEKIKSTPKILAFGRISKTAKQITKNVVEVNRVEEILAHISKDEEIAILASGDPCFYGIVDFLKTKKIQVGEVIPGLSSFQYMMAKLQKNWNEAVFVSFHGREGNIEKIIHNRLSIILTDSKNTPMTISTSLKERNMKGKIYVGFNLSYDNEEILQKRIGEHIENISSLAMVVVENEMD